MPDAPEDRGRGILLATGGMLLLSTESVTIRLAGTEPFVVVTWVGLLTSLVTLATTAWRDPAALRPDRGGTGVVLLAGALQGGTVVLFVCAVASTTVADVAVVIACAPLVTAVLAWALLRERSPARVWAAVAASVVGILIVTWGSMGGGRLGGVLLALGAVTAYSVLTVVFRRRPEISRPVVVGLGGVVMAVVGATVLAVSPDAGAVLGHPPRTWWAIAAMGLVVGPVSRVMLGLAPRHLPAAEVMLFAPLETVTATLWAALLLDESPPTATWVGGVVILAAVLWGVWPRPSRPARDGDHAVAAAALDEERAATRGAPPPAGRPDGPS